MNQSIPENLILQLDPIQIAETLTNVLMNAVEAMPSGGELTIKAFHAKKNIILEIKDTGIGMEKSVLKQVLNRFIRPKAAVITTLDSDSPIATVS